jgi:hypothetical protein
MLVTMLIWKKEPARVSQLVGVLQDRRNAGL